jgi:hypothetical protein
MDCATFSVVRFGTRGLIVGCSAGLAGLVAIPGGLVAGWNFCLSYAAFPMLAISGRTASSSFSSCFSYMILLLACSISMSAASSWACLEWTCNAARRFVEIAETRRASVSSSS